MESFTRASAEGCLILYPGWLILCFQGSSHASTVLFCQPCKVTCLSVLFFDIVRKKERARSGISNSFQQFSATSGRRLSYPDAKRGEGGAIQ